MFISMGLAVVIAMVYGLWLVDILSITAYMYSVIILTLVLDFVFYYLIQTWGVRQFERI